MFFTRRAPRAAGFVVATATAATIGSGLVATPAGATGDTTAPTLTGVQVVGQVGATLANVDVTNGAGSIGVTLHATDDSSGVSGLHVVVSCATGCTGSGPSTASSSGFGSFGPSTNAAGTVQISIPQTAQTGTWQVSEVDVSDASANQAQVTTLTAYDATRSFTVNKTPDTTAPALGSVTLPGPTLTVTTADQPLSLTVAASDSVPGVDHGSVTLACSSGCTDPMGFDHTGATKVFNFSASSLATGTIFNGTFTTQTQQFSWDDNGTWTVQSVDLYDGYGNHNGAGTSSATLTVNASADAAGPTVSGTTSFSPPNVDATTSGQTSNLTIHIDDNVSGFAFGFGSLDDGTDTPLSVNIDASQLTTGNIYVVPVSIPVQQPAGSYAFSSLTLFDRYGNSTPVDTSTFPALTLSTTPDPTNGPAITNFTVGPMPFNVADNPFRALTVSGDVTDDVSGFDHADLNLTDPDGNPVTAFSVLTAGNRTSGTALNGHFIGGFSPADVTSGTVAGTWHIVSIDLYDAAGNPHTDSTVASTFDVTTTPSGDVTPPALAHVTMSPPSVSTDTGDATVHVHVDVTDSGSGGGPASGLGIGFVTLQSPDGTQFASGGAFDVTQLTSGTDVNGGYDFDMTIPKFDEPGDWKITDVDLNDNVGNENDVTGAALFAIAGTPTVTVSGPVDLHAPVLAGLQASPTSVDTSVSGKVTFTIHATDDAASNDGSGVSGGRVTLTSPTARTYRAFFSSFNRTSGTAQDGVYTATVTLPRFVDSGSFSVSVDLFDEVDNSASYTSGDIAALGGGNTPTVSVTGAPDTHAPVVAAIQFNPASVSSAGGAVPMIVDVHITDNQASSDGSGVTDASIDLKSPHGTQSDMQTGLQLVSGTANDGWWEGGFTVPHFVDSGTWTINNLTADDVIGNSNVYDQAALTTAGLPTGVTITGASDTVGPAIASNGLTVPGSTVDVTTQDQQILVGVHLIDQDGSSGSGSGVDPDSGSVTVTGPNGATATGFFPSTPATGTADGTWNVPITIHKFTDDGTWNVTDVNVSDVYGNNSDITGPALTGFSRSFTVHSNPDTTAPALTSMSFSPSPADVSTGSVLVTVTVGVTDNGSGFDGGDLTMTGPHGQSLFANVNPTPATGTLNNGTFTAIVTVPRYAEAGTWTVTGLDLFDVVGNNASYPTPTPFPASNVTTTLSVLDSNPDTVAPAATAIAVTPSPVDVSGGQVQATFDFTLTDDKSGVAPNGRFTLQSPSGVASSYQLSTLTSGTTTNGHWLVTVPFGTHSENGTWTVTALDVTDTAGNSARITTLPATPTFTVSGGTPIAPGVPTNVFGFPGNGNVELSWDAPSNGGSPITGYDVLVQPQGGSPSTVHFDGTNTDQILSGLTNGTAYTFEVRAINAVGTSSYSSASPTVTPQPVAPGLPTGVTATAGDGQATVSWTAPADNGGSPITGYDVLVQPQGGSSSTQHFDASTTTRTITGLTNGTTYTFEVRALNGAPGGGSGPYSAPTASVTPASATPVAPGQPTGVSATTGVNSVVVSWSAPTTGGPVSSYTVTVKDAGTPVQTLSNATSPKTVTGLTAGKTYTFEVTASNAGGTSPAASTSAVAGGPANVSLTGKPAANTPSTSATFGFSVSPGSSVQCTLDGVTGACTTGSTAVYSGLAQGTHSFTVTATDASSQHATASYTWRVDSVAPTASLTKAGAATDLAKSFAVAWSGADTGGSGVTKYDVRYTKANWNGKPGAAVLWKSATTATSGTFSGVLGYEYCFSVRSYDAAGNVSGWSAARCSAIPLDDRALAASAGWKKLTGRAFFNGTVMQAAANGKTLTKKGAIAGRAVLIVDKGKGFGTINVLYNGKVVKKISLAATRTITKFAITLPRVSKTTTIVIKTTSAKKVQIDGLLLARV